MGKGLPPNPAQYRDPKQWMQQMYDFLVAETRVDQDNDPLPVLLPHRVAGVIERAGQSGVVMYDPTFAAMVVSNGAEWASYNAVPAFTAAEIASLTSDANTLYKKAGAVVYDSTNSTLAVANGSADSATWSRLTIAATVTPA
jgi:hypothetical protein